MTEGSQSPRVSIVTPTKNRLPLLLEAMASVRAQTFADWEHVIVDDGSDDGTAEEIERASKADGRVRFLRRTGEASGASRCRNQGVLAAKANLIVFLDSDDLLAPDCLARRVERITRNADCDFITFQHAVFVKELHDLNKPQDADLSGDDLGRFLYFELPWIITSPIWRKSALIRIGLLDDSLPSWQDVELHIRALTAGCKYLRFPEIDSHIRWQFEETKVSVLQRRSPRHLQAADTILKKFEALVREGPGMTWVRQRALCSLYFFVSELWIGLGKPAEAMACWREIRVRNLGPAPLHLAGKALLLLQLPKSPFKSLAARLAHKWKGLARLRINAELVEP